MVLLILLTCSTTLSMLFVALHTSALPARASSRR